MQGDQLLLRPLPTPGPEKGWREVDAECRTEAGAHGSQGHRPANHPLHAGKGTYVIN